MEVVLTYDLGAGEMLVVNVTKERLMSDASVYTRATGSAQGWIVGTNQTWENKSFLDEFTCGLKLRDQSKRLILFFVSSVPVQS